MARVLVIDDDEEIRETLIDLFRTKGHQVDGASNGKIALDMIAQNRPDVVITDIIMPEKDGIQFIAETRKKYGHIPIIAMSGGGRIPASVYLSHVNALGELVTLEKPFKVSALMKAVEDALCGTT